MVMLFFPLPLFWIILLSEIAFRAMLLCMFDLVLHHELEFADHIQGFGLFLLLVAILSVWLQ